MHTPTVYLLLSLYPLSLSLYTLSFLLLYTAPYNFKHIISNFSGFLWGFLFFISCIHSWPHMLKYILILMVKHNGKNWNDAITGSCWHLNLKWASSDLFKFFATVSILEDLARKLEIHVMVNLKNMRSNIKTVMSLFLHI